MLPDADSQRMRRELEGVGIGAGNLQGPGLRPLLAALDQRCVHLRSLLLLVCAAALPPGAPPVDVEHCSRASCRRVYSPRNKDIMCVRCRVPPYAHDRALRRRPGEYLPLGQALLP